MFTRHLCLALFLWLVPNVAAFETANARYVEIPISGDIGIEVTTQGFSDALDRASREARSDVLVLVIDSHGGLDIDAAQMADLLSTVKDKFRVIAAVRRAIGPAMAIVLASDELVVLDPSVPGVRIQYHPALGRQLTVDQEIYQRIIGLGPVARVMVQAMFDPSLPVYVWRDSNNKRQASTTRPDGIADVHEIPAGSMADGLSANELETLGIGQQAKDVADIGKVMGYSRWQRAANLNSIMQAAATTHSDQVTEIQKRLNNAMSMTSQALALNACLINLESNAREADPRRQPYRYRRSWGNRSGWQSGFGYAGSGWGYSAPTTRAWRANSDRAIAEWDHVIANIDQIFTMGGEAKEDLKWLKSQDIPASMGPWVAEEIKILESQLDPLLGQESVLMSQRRSAVEAVEFLRKNRSRPAV
ncbi:MAG: hypothetical protein CMJ40_05590 [Phycisphaerae bacterium]|nr:hypothetical protein [Phycisphaerae bacterium]|tara:strand:+ start:4140 stop:5393 length:1254 start_codon:yes stop_codon:yes gene_type:complete